jgi:cyclopropane fatty-acyl-phospholipid synthase-like methyltransferase
MNEYYKIKDDCRQYLIKYLENAITAIPKEGNYNVLDIGCGTGVPTLFFAEHFNGSITAIDTNEPALTFFQNKINESNLQNRIEIRNVNFFDFRADKNSFDIILAEGFLNVVGFEKGFAKVIELLIPGGYFIIHDEFKDHEKKTGLITQQNCTIIDLFYLDESIWWNNYYNALDTHIKRISNSELRACFKSDISEIEYFKTNPEAFRSVYYIVKWQDEKEYE